MNTSGNNSRAHDDSGSNLNNSYQEHNTSVYRGHDDSGNWDKQSAYSDSNWNYGSEYGSESNYSQSNYSYHGNQGMDTSYYGNNNSSHYQESTNDVDKAAKQ